MKKRRVIFIVFGVLILLAGVLTVKTFYDAGEFKTIKPHFKGQCRTVEGVLSSEDITILHPTGMAFISSADRRVERRGETPRQGAIFGLDLTDEKAEPVNLTEGFAKEFHPHGMGLYEGAEGNVSLFVISHVREEHFVEIFDYRAKTLTHRDTVKGELMHSPNDLIPVGQRSFYVTNDHGSKTELGRTLEEYLQLPKSYVLYFDGESFQKAAEGLGYANGINVSRDGKTIYVTAAVGRALHVYNRDENSGKLTERKKIDLKTGPDNIELDEQGRIWIGAHQKLLTFVKYSKNTGVLSPSQVIQVTIDKNGNDEVKEVYLDSGESLSASSVAAVFEDKMLIGSVMDPRFLICRLD